MSSGHGIQLPEPPLAKLQNESHPVPHSVCSSHDLCPGSSVVDSDVSVVSPDGSDEYPPLKQFTNKSYFHYYQISSIYIDLVLNLKIKIQCVPDDDSLDVELAPELSYVVSSELGP